MAIYVDTALPSEVEAALALGFVSGVTTNPALVAAAGRPAHTLLAELSALVPGGPVFHQVVGATLSDRIADAEAALAFPGVSLKVPATTENMALVRRFAADGVALTAMFAGAQALVGIAAGARWLIPYVNRTTRLLGDGLGFVRQCRQVADAATRRIEVLAASLKSPEEALQAALAGAHHVSLPLAVLLAMGDHPLSRDAIAEFDRAGTS